MSSRAVLASLLVLFAPGCATAQFDDATMSPVASALTKLSAAVDAYVSAEPNIPTTDKDILDAATAHDRELLQPFASYQLRVKVEGRNSAVLVCSADGAHALIEDAGCTAKTDRQAWRELGPCAATLDLRAVCTSGR